MIYDEETGRYFSTALGMKNYKGVVAYLKKQKPVTREKAIAQVQKLKAASQRNKESRSNAKKRLKL